MKYLKKIIVYASLIILLFIAGYLTSNYKNTSSIKNDCQQRVTQQTNKNNVLLSSFYFDDFKGIWGEASSGSDIKWQAIDSEFNQRSMPGAVTHIPSFKKVSTKIILVKRADIKIDFGSTIVDEVYKTYGDLLGGFFAGKGEAITSVKNFDVDSDGVKEQIVETVTIGGNHPPYFGYIIKNGIMILSTNLDGGAIEQTKDGNGFYLKNTIRDDGQPLCCSNGYRLYRIVYEDDLFRPVWEQEVKYIRVNGLSIDNGITKEKAINIVSNYPEVKNFLERMEKAKVKTIVDANEQTNKKSKIWLVQVAENYRDHTATFNWYILDKYTGKFLCSFAIYNQKGEYVSNNDKYPCN